MVHQNKKEQQKLKTYYMSRALYLSRSPLLGTQCIQYTYHFTAQMTTLLESTYKQCVGRPSVGLAHQQRCSNVSYARSQVRGPHKHIFVSYTIYLTTFPLKFGYSLTQS